MTPSRPYMVPDVELKVAPLIGFPLTSSTSNCERTKVLEASTVALPILLPR